VVIIPVCELPVYFTVFPPAVAVSVDMVDVPPIFSVPVAPLVKLPVPMRVVAAVSVPLLVYVPVIEILAIDVVLVPLKDIAVPLKVCIPVSAVNVVELLTKLFENVKVGMAEVAVSVQIAPLFKVISPLNVIKLVVEVDPKLNVPVTDVAPFTINGRFMVSVAPELIVNPAQVIVPLRVVTTPAPVVAITAASVVAGATPPTHVAPTAQSPPAVVLVIVAAYNELVIDK
jgi:hypothetical protein